MLKQMTILLQIIENGTKYLTIWKTGRVYEKRKFTVEKALVTVS